MQHIFLPEVIEDQNSQPGKLVTEAELSANFQKTNSEKCPGSGRFTNEFYKKFQSLFSGE